MSILLLPVSDFRYSSNESTAQEFDDGTWRLAIGWGNNETRILPPINLRTTTAIIVRNFEAAAVVDVSPYIPIGKHCCIETETERGGGGSICR